MIFFLFGFRELARTVIVNFIGLDHHESDITMSQSSNIRKSSVSGINDRNLVPTIMNFHKLLGDFSIQDEFVKLANQRQKQTFN